jgi:hypothetical protein
MNLSILIKTNKWEVLIMKQITVLLIKFVTCVIAFTVGLDLFFDATIVDILSFSLFITIVSYVIGDVIVLRQLGKRAATAIDFLLTYLSVWVFGSILLDNYIQIGWGSIISAIIITTVEVFVHSFLNEPVTAKQKTKRERNSGLNPTLAYGTEFAEEESIQDLSRSKK